MIASVTSSSALIREIRGKNLGVLPWFFAAFRALRGSIALAWSSMFYGFAMSPLHQPVPLDRFLKRGVQWHRELEAQFLRHPGRVWHQPVAIVARLPDVQADFRHRRKIAGDFF